jgi:Fe-S-cluster-containing dehydrogenase component
MDLPSDAVALPDKGRDGKKRKHYTKNKERKSLKVAKKACNHCHVAPCL